MIIRKATLSFLLALLFLHIQAQNSISGRISDANGGIYFSTVALYTADSNLVAGVVTDDKGDYRLEQIPNGTCFVKISMLGYATLYENLEFPRDHEKRVDRELSEDTNLLATAEIVARKPLLVQKADRLIVNVADNLTSLNNSLLDVMKKVPGVIVAGDKMTMAGQRNVTIMINGKTTQYMDVNALLKDMPGDNVERVEVIHQPGAEFDAQGTGPIINIVLKNNSLFGTNGSVDLGIAKGRNWKYRTGANFSNYQGKVNFTGGVGYRINPNYDEMALLRNVQGDTYTQRTVDPNRSNSWRVNIGTDWDITSRHRIGFSSQYIDSRSDNVAVNTTDIDFLDDQNPNLKLVTNNISDDEWKMATFNPYYSFAIDTAGQKFDIDFNVVDIQNKGLSTLENEEKNFGVDFGNQQYRQPGSVRIYTAQADYAYPFSKNFKISTGAKYSTAALDNNLGSFNSAASGGWLENLQQSNHFLFDENIGAAYSKVDWLAGKWSGTAGLRYEDSHSKGYSITLDSTTIRDIEKFFPSASLGYELTKQLGLTFAYSYRIDRPRYSNLNPFVYFLDPFTFERGNPLLRPALSHSMKFNLAYENQPFFFVEYKTTDNAMVEVTQQDDATGQTSLTTVNLASFNVFNTTLGFPLDFIPKVNGYGAIIANHAHYKSPYLDAVFDAARWTYTGYLQADISLPKDVTAQVQGWAVSGALEGLINSSHMYGVDVGLSRKFLDDKMKVSLGCDGILQRFLHADIEYSNMDLSVFNRWDAPVVNFQVSYNFGNQHMKSNKKHDSSASDEVNRAEKG